MRRILKKQRSQIAKYLVELLYTRPHRRLPAVAFLNEVSLMFLDGSERNWEYHILQCVPRHLRSHSSTKWYLGLKALLVLCKGPSMARSMKDLLPALMLLLQTTDGEMLAMTLLALIKVSHQVQLLSIELLQYVMKIVLGSIGEDVLGNRGDDCQEAALEITNYRNRICDRRGQDQMKLCACQQEEYLTQL